MKMFFTLECGRKVAVDAFYYQRTYLSLLEGRPNKEMNDRIIERCNSEMRPLWGERRVYVIPPVDNQFVIRRILHCRQSDSQHGSRVTSRFSQGTRVLSWWLFGFDPNAMGSPLPRLFRMEFMTLRGKSLHEILRHTDES